MGIVIKTSETYCPFISIYKVFAFEDYSFGRRSSVSYTVWALLPEFHVQNRNGT